MSFSSLPTELVRQIIESSVPSNFDMFTYEDRQTALRNLALVSLRFARIAQPALFVVAWFKTFQEVDTVLDDIEGRGWSHVLREVFIEATGFYAASQLNSLALKSQGLRSLVLYLPQGYPLDLYPIRLVPGEYI